MPPFPFYVAANMPAGAPATAGLLKPNNWDDYGYKTTFDLEVRFAGAQTVRIGPVKILARDYHGGTPTTSKVLDVPFESLQPAQFCSLGQESNYYARMGRLEEFGAPAGAAQSILVALADIGFVPPQTEKWWEDSAGLHTSLLRFPDAYIARREAAALVEGKTAGEDLIHSIPLRDFTLPFELHPRKLELGFDATGVGPGRINVLVGKNGAGKSSLLRAIAGNLTSAHRPRGEGYLPIFSRVVFVSFNAFDSQSRMVAKWERSDLRFIGYKPGDLAFLESAHKLAETEVSPERWLEEIHRLLPDAETLVKCFPALTSDRARLVDLRNDPEWISFATVALGDADLANALSSDPARAIDFMSPGQTILTSLLAGLFVHVDRRSLVLIDEPENHLHPSMLASFVRHLSMLLNHRFAYAVIATHSPVVIQETLSKHVWVMHRDGEVSSLVHPPWETFGESIDNITEYLFETDWKQSNWKGLLRDCADAGKSLDEVQTELGSTELPLLARTLFHYFQAKKSGVPE